MTTLLFGRRMFLARVGFLAAGAAAPLSSLTTKAQSAVERWRALGMRVEANIRVDYPYPNVTHSIWAPFRDDGGGTSHQLIGFLDRLGRFITDHNYHQGVR